MPGKLSSVHSGSTPAHVSRSSCERSFTPGMLSSSAGHLADDVCPVGHHIAGLRPEGRHADDGNVARLLGTHHGDPGAEFHVIKAARTALANIGMEFGHGNDAVTQGGNLADHVHAP